MAAGALCLAYGFLFALTGSGLAAPPADPRGSIDRLPAPAAEARITSARYTALLFAAQDYSGGLPKLGTPNNDIAQIGAVLHDQYGFDVRPFPNATRATILDALGELQREALSDDVVLIYYAGHGVETEAGVGYWQPIDAAPNSQANWISTVEVSAIVSAMQARHVFVVSDSCYSAAFAKGSGPIPTEQMSSALADDMFGKRSRLVLTSGEHEPVADGGADRMSVFAYYLREQLRQNPARFVTPNRFFPQLQQAVYQASSGKQTPALGTIVHNSIDVTNGQPVLVNTRSCADGGTEQRVRDAEEQSRVAYREMTEHYAGPDACKYLDGLNEWIATWSPRTVDACGSPVPIHAPDLADATDIRATKLAQCRPGQPAWPKVLAASGVVVGGSGVGMALGSHSWFVRNAEHLTTTTGGDIVYDDPQVGETLRTMQAVNVTGIALAAVGASMGLGGTIGLLTGPDGRPRGVAVTAVW